MSRSSQPAASLAAPQSTEPEPLLFSSSSSSTSSSSPTPIMDALSRILDARPSADTMSIVATTVIVTLATFYFCRYVLYPKWRRIIPSPLRASLPKEASHAIHDHIYNPDTLPGGRDVTTPYGTVRVYEFGNLEGPKVLLVHGISTPCITLAPLARALAARGCRVMVFDLFGRGFTDGVGDLPHDERLYTTNILLALASSPLPWTGQHGFRLVGYSLGGALAASFAASFPHMVESLILLAPAGLISAADFGTVARLTFRSGLVPRRLLAFATKRRLQRPIAASTNRKPTLRQQPSATGKILDVAASETTHPSIPPPEMPLERRVDDYVRWMVTHHAGFVPAFMSCIRHAPLTDQHPTWAQLGRVMGKGRTAVLLAQGDEIIDCVDYERQGLPLLGGPDAVHWRVLGGTHDFVMTHTGDIAAELDHFWGMKAPEAEA